MAPSKELVAAGSRAVEAINPDQTLKASKALLAHIKKSSKQQAEASTKRNLLNDAGSDSDDADVDDTPVWLTLTTKRHISDKARLQPGKISLPNSLNGDEHLTVCLITADPQRAYKDIVASEEFPAELRKRVTRVIGIAKLKAKFSQYEAQRKLFAEHDVFLADDRIINRLPKVLGKTFYKTMQKRPIPVVLQPKAPKAGGKKTKRVKTEGQVSAAPAPKIAKEIEKALSSALVSLAPTTNTAVRIGWASFTPEQIADNVDAVVTGLVGKWVPQKWRNVRSIHIKGPNTAALPIWLTDELWMDENDVVADTEEAKALKEASKKRKAGEAEEAPKNKKKKTAAAATTKSDKAQPDGDDGELDKKIAERKAKLKKQKSAAKKAMDN